MQRLSEPLGVKSNQEMGGAGSQEGLAEESHKTPQVLNPAVLRNSLPLASLGSWVLGAANREESGAREQETGSTEALHAGSDSLHLVQEAVELRQG